jgi:hypothetical protein
MIQFHGVGGRVKQESPVTIGQEVAQVQRLSCLASNPHLAIDESLYGEPARVAASLKLVHVKYQTDLRL